MNFKSLARRAAVFVFGHVVLLGAVMAFAGSVRSANAPASVQVSIGQNGQ